MEMRGMEEIGEGEDLTPPLAPLAAVLHDSLLTSLCSACFSALPSNPFPPSIPTIPEISHLITPTPLYCSLHCSSIDSHLHSSSVELHLLSLFARSPPSLWHHSSDLRLSLRLVHILSNLLQECSLNPQMSFSRGKNESFYQGSEQIESPDDSIGNEAKKIENLERIAGLMTNRENLILGEIKKHQFECEGRAGSGEDYGENAENILLKIREGAEMMAKARRMSVGEDVNVENRDSFELEEMVLCLVMTNAVEVQVSNGNSLGIAVYDAAFSWINHSCSPNSCYRFLVGKENDEQQPLRIAPAAIDGNGKERNGYLPRLVVRSIKTIRKGEEITIAYTDLLQPKETRQAELWLKYRFSCCCMRCAAVPTTYVDYALQASIVENPKSYSEVEKLMQNIDEAITDYLSFGDSTSCCQKLENLLYHGDKEAKSPQKVKLHPFNYFSLSAYTTLASAYKVEASDKLALSSDLERHKLEALNMCKTSCAYSLLLAGVANHLYMSEPAIVATVANFWINAGESLVNLARSSSWDAFLGCEPFQLELSSFLTLKCDDCYPADISARADEKSGLFNCIANLTPKAWSFLTCDSSFLKLIENPIKLSCLEISDAGLKRPSSRLEAGVCNEEVRRNLISLSFHCLSIFKKKIPYIVQGRRPEC